MLKHEGKPAIGPAARYAPRSLFPRPSFTHGRSARRVRTPRCGTISAAITPPVPVRAPPSKHLPWPTTNVRWPAPLMRVNHVGEVCAQALYSAQALATRDPALRRQFEQAARARN